MKFQMNPISDNWTAAFNSVGVTLPAPPKGFVNRPSQNILICLLTFLSKGETESWN